jgi:hypothetical protein
MLGRDQFQMNSRLSQPSRFFKLQSRKRFDVWFGAKQGGKSSPRQWAISEQTVWQQPMSIEDGIF